MWHKRAHTLALLSFFVRKVKYECIDVENDGFIAMKKIVVHDLLHYKLNFSERFIICTDASKMQIGGAISQNENSIGFYSHKLTPAQMNYTTIE